MVIVLIVEDDATIGGVVESSLRAHGYDVVWVTDGRTALAKAATTEFDLVLIDLGLPDLDGIEVCRRLRRKLPAAVLVMLTARSAEMDVIVGLDAGADDYLTKPVHLGELLARIRAHLRRVGSPAASQSLFLGDLVLDMGSRRVTIRGTEVTLRTKEFDLLARLAREPDAAVSRETLMADVWDQNWIGSTKTLDVHVASLRSKIGSGGTSAHVPMIRTLRGYGYRLELPAGSGTNRAGSE
ncbi:response regulator transcription factor [Pseudonocardia sp.]|uniref:response regulator transcription factor n=1 Tax=Pseudonocardia sp. TaxID=60912 RepID=UPI0026100419|nr:response regulator transcription factor [Pseudonocardia sp.]